MLRFALGRSCIGRSWPMKACSLPKHSLSQMTPRFNSLSSYSAVASTAITANSTASPILHAIGDMQALGLTDSYFSGWVPLLTEYLHCSHSLPFYASILLVTLGSRLILLPFQVQTQKGAIHAYNHSDEMKRYQMEMSLAQSRKDVVGMQRIKNEYFAFCWKHGIGHVQLLYALPMAVVSISVFMGLNAMISLPVPALTVGGFGPILDLTRPDPWLSLPFISAICLLYNFEQQIKVNPQSANMRGFMGVLSVISLFFSSMMPAAYSLSFAGVAVMMVLQNGLFRSSLGQRLFRLPRRIPPRSQTTATGLQNIPSFTEYWQSVFAPLMPRFVAERRRQKAAQLLMQATQMRPILVQGKK